jgi:uncharacterized protein (TIGR02284 family)
MASSDVVSILNGLIEVSKDGEYGFRACAKQADSQELQQFLSNRADACAKAASDLQIAVVQYGGTADTAGSVTGAMHRGWVAMTSALTGYADLRVLEECERGEDAALHAYQNALKEELPVEVKSLLTHQYEGVKRNHDEIRRLRDQFKAAA